MMMTEDRRLQALSLAVKAIGNNTGGDSYYANPERAILATAKKFDKFLETGQTDG